MRDANSSRPRKRASNIFAIDHRSWRDVCQIGLNAAVAYLVLARGTGGDNRTTSWSTHSIESRTGISRPRVKAAIGTLKEAGLIEERKGGKRPRYWLVPHVQDETPEWIWLPNCLVDAPGGAESPIERLRQGRDLYSLWVFVDLYRHQRLDVEWGIPWRIGERGFRQHFHREKVNERAEFVVWKFRKCHEIVPTAGWPAEATSAAASLASRLSHLHSIGLIEIIPHLVDVDDEQGEILHALASNSSEEIEESLAFSAQQAAAPLLQPFHCALFNGDDSVILAPVLRHIQSVTMVGILRLRYRPDTEPTARWRAKVNSRSADQIARYKAIEDRFG